MDKTATRSAGYQHVIVELLCSPEILAERSDAQGYSGVINNCAQHEELMDLKDQLIVEFWRLVDTKLTPRQAEVLHLYSEGLTQIEIAKKLGVNQSSITKSINGNCDYKNGKVIYGGSRKKLIKLSKSDPKIREILEKMKDASIE